MLILKIKHLKHLWIYIQSTFSTFYTDLSEHIQVNQMPLHLALMAICDKTRFTLTKIHNSNSYMWSISDGY